MKNVFLRVGCLCLLLCPLLPVKEAFAVLSTGCQAVNTKGSYTGSDIYWQQIVKGYTFSTGETLKITFSNPSKSGQTAHINAGTSAASGVPASFSSKASSSSFPATLTYTLDQDYTYVKFNITSGNVDMTDMECRKSQVITFNDPGAQQLSSGTATLTASSDSGLTVSLASSTTGVCTVSGTTLTLVSAGTCTITASQGGGGDYFSATDVTRSFSVTASSGGGGGGSDQAQTITFNDPGEQQLSSGTATLTASSDSGLTVSLASSTTGVCTVSGTTLTLVSAGTCTITASQGGGGGYLAATDVSRSFSVTASSGGGGGGSDQAQTITFNDPGEQQLSSGTATLTASSDSGLTVSLASSTTGVCTVSGTTLTLVSAGTCTITASQDGGGGYLAATDVSRSFSVTASSGGGSGRDGDGEEEDDEEENLPPPVDNVRPVVKVSVLGLENDARTSQPSWRVAIEISEVVTGFNIDDFLLSNLTISEFSGSGREFSALVSSVTPGRSSISVPEDGCQDNANNLNLESNSVSWRYEPDLLLNKSVTAVARAYASLTQEYLRNFSQPINSRFARLDQVFGGQIAIEACQSDESEGQPEIPGCNQDDIDSGDINSDGLSYQGIQFTFRDPVMRSIFSGQPDKADPRGLLPDLETLINSPSEIDSSKELIGRVIGATLAATDLEPVDLNPSGDASTAGWSIWTEGQVTVGNWDSVDSSDGVLIAIGSDRAVGDYARGGLALTASWQSTEINPNDDVDAENYGLSFYGAMRPKEMALVLEGILGAADLNIASTRKEATATFSADRDGTMLFSSIGVRGLKPVGRRFQITPHGRFELGSAKIDTESETGDVWAVQYGDQNIDHQMLFIGLDINYQRALPKGLIRPFGSAEYGYSFSSSENVTLKYPAGKQYYNLVLEDETDATVRIQLGLDYVSNDGLISALVYTRNEALGAGHSDGVRIHISSAF